MVNYRVTEPHFWSLIGYALNEVGMVGEATKYKFYLTEKKQELIRSNNTTEATSSSQNLRDCTDKVADDIRKRFFSQIGSDTAARICHAMPDDDKVRQQA